MTANTLSVRFPVRLKAYVLGVVGLLALAGCKTDKEERGGGSGVGRRKGDPLVSIPKQDLPLPDANWGIGSKGKPDPLTSPTGGRNDKVGYNDDPERFKGTYIPNRTSTPASLAGRIRDGEELKIESPGVKLQPAGGVMLEGAPSATDNVSVLVERLEKLGVKREDYTLEREDGKYVCRVSVPISAEGARRQYTGMAVSAYDAVKQVVDQIAADQK
ncbi:unnamed protein product [Gemmata massiliana]|uniref:Uncharacterized protein n=1 Tax=Gemmata massiliana TaxID=1210884 RepID=A0A6P2CQ75_9BACT|nr:hypothetical protein [Gemmata massiliana]VTR90717.1 unnamed protein product [Gemmata massiliana]